MQCFLWLLTKNKVLTRDNLSIKRKVEDKTCLFCCELETVNHLFFDCTVARQLWAGITVVFNIHLEPTLDSVGKFWLSNKRNCVFNIIASAALWISWKLRNELRFQNTLAEYGYALAQDYCFGSELASSMPGGQKYAEDQDPGAQDKIGDVIMAAKWVKTNPAGNLERNIGTFWTGFFDSSSLA